MDTDTHAGDGIYSIFSSELILMVNGSDPHFTDRITQMALTLKEIHMIGEAVRKTADEVCQGKVVDFPGSVTVISSR